MTFEQLQCFIASVEEKTFLDAAHSLYISQSSLSKQIMKLEKELELTLWDRSKRTAVLTPEGEFFYKEALKISRQYHRSMEAVSHFKDRTLCGITNVGYKPTIGEKFLGVETYLFDCEEDLYGEPCRVEFFHYSRPEKRFSSIEALKQQLLKDAEKGKAYFRSLEK